MQLKRFVLGPLKTNSYLIWDESTNKAAVIDPSDEGGFISNKILENDLTLTKIILTHGHFDHVNGLLELKLNFSHVPILMHQDDLKLYKKAPQSTKHWTNQDPGPVPPIDEFIKDKQLITIGDSQLKVIHTPGHTPGSICLYNKQDDILFSGDTLFKDGFGRVDFSYSSPTKMKQSLKKLAKLPGHTQAFPGHGDFTYIDRELVS